VEHYFGEVNWTIGEMEGYDSVTRDLQTPPVYGHPDTYGGAYWVDVVGCTPASNNDFCGVHINCGVGNKMFYLLSEGGEHNGYVVEPIGIMKAMQIAFRANMVEWETDVTYEKAHEGMRNAAEYLFGGVGSPEYAAVNTAWNAVGVYAP
jgi:Zn-dependent metalloprotease